MQGRPASLTLKEIVVRVFKREEGRRNLSYMLACRLAADDYESKEGRIFNYAERRTLQAIGSGIASFDTIRANSKLSTIILVYYYQKAKIEITDEESKMLGRALLKETAYWVMLKVYLSALGRFVPNRQHFLEHQPNDNWPSGFYEFFEWLSTGQGTPDTNRAEEYKIIERRTEFSGDLFKRLWTECPEECKAMDLPDPPHRVPMTDGQKRVWDALSGRALTGKELTNELETSEDTVRQWVRELRANGFDVPNKRGRGYYRLDAPPNDLAPSRPM